MSRYTNEACANHAFPLIHAISQLRDRASGENYWLARKVEAIFSHFTAIGVGAKLSSGKLLFVLVSARVLSTWSPTEIS